MNPIVIAATLNKQVLTLKWTSALGVHVGDAKVSTQNVLSHKWGLTVFLLHMMFADDLYFPFG
jgi:hypothetical protein